MHLINGKEYFTILEWLEEEDCASMPYTLYELDTLESAAFNLYSLEAADRSEFGYMRVDPVRKLWLLPRAAFEILEREGYLKNPRQPI